MTYSFSDASSPDDTDIDKEVLNTLRLHSQVPNLKCEYAARQPSRIIPFSTGRGSRHATSAALFRTVVKKFIINMEHQVSSCTRTYVVECC